MSKERILKASNVELTIEEIKFLKEVIDYNQDLASRHIYDPYTRGEFYSLFNSILDKLDKAVPIKTL
jgi:hypothetical protein